jgi:hypothetical protein
VLWPRDTHQSTLVWQSIRLDLTNISEQLLGDQKRVIHRKNLLSAIEINLIKEDIYGNQFNCNNQNISHNANATPIEPNQEIETSGNLNEVNNVPTSDTIE